MPWFRDPETGQTFHARMSKAPVKKCQTVGCGAPHTKLCDYPDPTRKTGTCDQRICNRCATYVGPNTDYCPAHGAMLARAEHGQV